MIWGLCFLIVLQVIWIVLRVNQLEKTSSTYLSAQKQKQTDDQLKKIPQPEIKLDEVKTAKLFLKLVDSYKVEIWAQSTEPIIKADIRR